MQGDDRVAHFTSPKIFTLGMKMLVKLIVAIYAVYDPERLLDRMHYSLRESLQMLSSYAHSQRLVQEHQELVKIYSKLERAADDLHAMSQNASH